MKKIFLLALAFNASLFFVHASDWLLNLQKKFPEQKFIYAVGEGTSEAGAKKAALAELAAHFGQTVETQIRSRRELLKVNSEYSDKSRFASDTLATAKSELFCVRYAPCHYDKRKKTYSSCAYIDRDEAWNILARKMDSAVSGYKSAARLLDAQGEPLKKAILCGKAQKHCEEFLELWQNALVVSSKKCGSYSSFANLAADNAQKFSALKKTAAICVSVVGGRGNVVRAKICDLLSQNGIPAVSKNAPYSLRAKVLWNESEFNNVFSCVPQIEIAIDGKNGTAASFAAKCQKVSAYNSETLARMALFALETLLDERFVQECLD